MRYHIPNERDFLNFYMNFEQGAVYPTFNSSVDIEHMSIMSERGNQLFMSSVEL